MVANGIPKGPRDRAGCSVHQVCRGPTEPGRVIRGPRAGVGANGPQRRAGYPTAPGRESPEEQKVPWGGGEKWTREYSQSVVCRIFSRIFAGVHRAVMEGHCPAMRRAYQTERANDRIATVSICSSSSLQIHKSIFNHGHWILQRASSRSFREIFLLGLLEANELFSMHCTRGRCSFPL